MASSTWPLDLRQKKINTVQMMINRAALSACLRQNLHWRHRLARSEVKEEGLSHTDQIVNLIWNWLSKSPFGCQWHHQLDLWDASPLISSLARSEVKEEGPSHTVQIGNLIWNWENPLGRPWHHQLDLHLHWRHRWRGARWRRKDLVTLFKL